SDLLPPTREARRGDDAVAAERHLVGAVRLTRRHNIGVDGDERRRPDLGPAADVLREARTLHADDAEALTGGRLHHHPTLQAIDHRSAQLLQPRHLGWDVVGLDVDVDAALMVHALDLDD